MLTSLQGPGRRVRRNRFSLLNYTTVAKDGLQEASL
ncbi:hypothetical protein HU200_054625 [Digitaria exilis]|uniref:Uncharacterized protein n=1 Tax=Digitaria exilis TaxID=1010633 RepID=A0A835AM50_9POAL|nr:hypothetical protein HU200_054625 [Digitaria exilis]